MLGLFYAVLGIKTRSLQLSHTLGFHVGNVILTVQSLLKCLSQSSKGYKGLNIIMFIGLSQLVRYDNYVCFPVLRTMGSVRFALH